MTDSAAASRKPYFYVYSKEPGEDWNQETGFKTLAEAKEEVEGMRSPPTKHRIVKVPYNTKWTKGISSMIEARLATQKGSGIVDCMDIMSIESMDPMAMKMGTWKDKSYYLVLENNGDGTGSHVMTTTDVAKVNAKVIAMHDEGKKFSVHYGVLARPDQKLLDTAVCELLKHK